MLEWFQSAPRAHGSNRLNVVTGSLEVPQVKPSVTATPIDETRSVGPGLTPQRPIEGGMPYGVEPTFAPDNGRLRQAELKAHAACSS